MGVIGGMDRGVPRVPYHRKMVASQNHQEPVNFQKTNIIVVILIFAILSFILSQNQSINLANVGLGTQVRTFVPKPVPWASPRFQSISSVYSYVTTTNKKQHLRGRGPVFLEQFSRYHRSCQSSPSSKKNHGFFFVFISFGYILGGYISSSLQTSR